MYRDVAIALSWANVCYLNVWTILLGLRDYDEFFMKAPPGPIEYVAVISNVLILSGVCLPLIHYARRGSRVAQWIFLVSVLVPLLAVRRVVMFWFPVLQLDRLVSTLGVGATISLSILLLGLGLVLISRWGDRCIHATVGTLLILVPFVPMTFAQAAWRGMTWDPTPFRDRPSGVQVEEAVRRPASRVLWLVFDGWDRKLTFEERARGLALPELDRLRAEAIYGEDALPPGEETLLSMPSVITGRRVEEAKVRGASELLLRFGDSPDMVRWSAQPTIFSRASADGFRSALLGWYLPYCRVINVGLESCEWWEWNRFTRFTRIGHDLASVLRVQARSIIQITGLGFLSGSEVLIERENTYLEMLENAMQLVRREDIDLMLIHWSIPHFPHFYNRATGEFVSEFSRSQDSDYSDSLALVDRTLGELRDAMEGTGVWNNSTILVTSDHSRDRKPGDRVPFLLKLAGQKKGLSYGGGFNTVVSHDLLLGVLRGDILTPSAVINWLNGHLESVSDCGTSVG